MSLHSDELYWCRVGGVFNFIVEEREECLVLKVLSVQSVYFCWCRVCEV